RRDRRGVVRARRPWLRRRAPPGGAREALGAGPRALPRHERRRLRERARGGEGGGRAARLHVLLHRARPVGARRARRNAAAPRSAVSQRLRAHEGARRRRGALRRRARRRRRDPLPGRGLRPRRDDRGQPGRAHGRRPHERAAARPRRPRGPALVVRLRRGRGRGSRARARERQGRRPLRAGRRERDAPALLRAAAGDRRHEAAAPADPVRGRLRGWPGAVAVGRAHRPPAAAHARRGRRVPAGVGLRQLEGRGRARLRVAAARRGTARDGALAPRRRSGRRARDRFVSLGRGELSRRIVHVSCVAFALLLRWLTWPQAALVALAAFVFNWQVLPRLFGRGMWRSADVARGYPIGILAYPLAVLALILFFRDRLWMAAAGWGILAVGDGMAGLVGQLAGGPRLPWNPRKGWTGLVAFVLCGAAAAAFLSAWVARLPLEADALHWPRTVGAAFALAAVCALVESLPTTLDDNVTVPLATMLALPLIASAEPVLLAGDPGLGRRLLVGLAL